ncbi:MAG TPA: family 1 glycosylhydrolase [Phenylobacterium sp.]
MLDFLFATGVENSAPQIRNRTHRVDQMEACGHYLRWRDDFDAVQSLGLTVLRYGPPLYRTFTGPDSYDWSFADETFADLKRRGVLPIADLCHFGVPDWIGDFQNPDFPELFASYARAFATRFDWVQLYTPVNEMLVCATYSARLGWWNEQLASDTGFVTALKHLVRANVLAMRAILEVRPDAIFIQSEASQRFHTRDPAALPRAEFMNAYRFLSLDLNYGRHVEAPMYVYLRDGGMTGAEYGFFFRNQDLLHHCVMGNDYYASNEFWIGPDGGPEPAGEIFGYDDITRSYFERYGLPVMHTETNHAQGPKGTEAVDWLWKQWANVLHLRTFRVPILGFTWYSLTDQVGWDNALRDPGGQVNPYGLFDLDRQVRPVGQAYADLIRRWRGALFTREESFQVLMPGDHP